LIGPPVARILTTSDRRNNVSGSLKSLKGLHIWNYLIRPGNGSATMRIERSRYIVAINVEINYFLNIFVASPSIVIINNIFGGHFLWTLPNPRDCYSSSFTKLKNDHHPNC
jgi:hypothetical protein